MKIKAYTLMEVTVAMLLSAICISICYTAYGLIGDYYRVFHQKNQVADQVLFLRHALEKDFLKSSMILKQENGFELQVDTTKIIYAFDEQSIVRKYGVVRIDTFKLATKELLTLFEGKEGLAQDTIDEVHLKIFLDQQTLTNIQLHKLYSAKDLFH